VVRHDGRIVSVINYTFSRVRDRLVSFRQKLGQNRKVSNWIECAGLRRKIDNVCWRMFLKVLLERRPGTRRNSGMSVETWGFAENIAREWK